MTMRVTAADVLKAGVTIQPEEAVAIAQQLIAAFRSGGSSGVVEPPFGPPTPDRVVLNADGSVVCRGCETTPVVSEIAILLQALLPPPPAHVPGGLRYTVARALLDVDVAPFDSLDDLSQTLARYERGPRDQIVIRLLQRMAASRTLTPAAFAERRRPTHSTELRRALRDAELQLYQQQRVLQEPTARPVALEGVIVSPRPPRTRRVAAAIAYVAAGALLAVTGEFAYRSTGEGAMPPIVSPAADVGRAPSTTSTPPEAAASEVGMERSVERRTAGTDVRLHSPHTAAANQASATRVSSTAAAKRATHPRRIDPDAKSHRGGGKESVLDRLKLRWLRNVFARPSSERRSS